MEIEACGEDLAEFAAVVADRDDEVSGTRTGEATGMSRSLSSDEAFADAVGNLPRPFPRTRTRSPASRSSRSVGCSAGCRIPPPVREDPGQLGLTMSVLACPAPAMSGGSEKEAHDAFDGEGDVQDDAREAGRSPEAAASRLRQAAAMTTTPQPETPQPRDIALEQATPEQAADLEARSEPEVSSEEN